MNLFELLRLRFPIRGAARWLALTVCMIALSPCALFAQSHVITGKVVDEKGMPIIGANVIVDGSTVGTNTDIDGNFTLRVTPPSIRRWWSCIWAMRMRNCPSVPEPISK